MGFGFCFFWARLTAGIAAGEADDNFSKGHSRSAERARGRGRIYYVCRRDALNETVTPSVHQLFAGCCSAQVADWRETWLLSSDGGDSRGRAGCYNNHVQFGWRCSFFFFPFPWCWQFLAGGDDAWSCAAAYYSCVSTVIESAA